MPIEPETRKVILDAAKGSLIDRGYGSLSTRGIAERAGVPLSQIHYHYGSKQNLLLAVLEEENRRLLERQSSLYSSDMPLWKQWEQACDFLEDDLDSGYVRVLQEMIAAGWSGGTVAAALRDLVARARAGRLRSSEVAEATMTVTNLGDQGVEEVHGVIHPPQVALVGFGRVADRPWAVGGLLGVRPVVRATLAADHRASDGHTGGRLLTVIDRLLRSPAQL